MRQSWLSPACWGLYVLMAVAAVRACAGQADQDQLTGRLSVERDKSALTRIAKLLLLDRNVRQEQVQGTVKVNEVKAVFDPATGVFAAKGLAPQGAYDLYVELADGTRIEGVDLTPKTADPKPLPLEAKQYIEKHFYEMKQFTNENRILALTGNGQSAAALVELCRTGGFHASGADIVWRIERWDYSESFGGWKCEGQKVLRRFRIPGREWAAWKWLFCPAWGGLRPGGDEKKLVLPELNQLVGRHPDLKPVALKPASAPEAPGKKAHVEDSKELRDPDLKPPPEEK